MELLSYEGKRVVVAGGGGTGMGASVARLVGDLGGEVHVLDLRDPTVPAASFSHTDLGDPASIAEAAARIGAPVHTLFNCQGISGTAPGATSVDVMRVNFLGVRHLTELVLPSIPAGGAVASISSAGGLAWPQRLPEVLGLLDTDGFDAGLAWVEEADPRVSRRGLPDLVRLLEGGGDRLHHDALHHLDLERRPDELHEPGSDRDVDVARLPGRSRGGDGAAERP